MSPNLKDKLLVIVFYLLLFIVAGELSYLYFSHQPLNLSSLPFLSSSPSPSPAPSPTSIPSSQSTFSPQPTVSSPTPTINSDIITQLTSLIPTPYAYITDLKLKITLKGILTQKTDNSLTLTLPNQKPLTIHFYPSLLNKTQIMTPNSSSFSSHSLDILQLHKQTTIETILTTFPSQPDTQSLTITQY